MTARLVAISTLAVLAPVFAAACSGDDQSASATLPPIITTTTTTTMPTTTTEYVPVTYEIQPGDSLQSIADQFGVSARDIALLNSISDPDRIEAGSIIEIPPITSAP